MVQLPVEDGCGDARSHRAGLIAPVNELGEEVGALAVDGQASDLVDHK